MSKSEQNTQPADAGGAEQDGNGAADVDVYEAELDRFRTGVEDDPEATVKRSGFVMFHSLSAEEQVLTRERLGMPCRDAVDYYNLGVAHASRDEMDKAVECWRRAVKSDPTLAQAEFNLAVACEGRNRVAEAVRHYQKYCELIDDAEELEQVAQHLAELGA